MTCCHDFADTQCCLAMLYHRAVTEKCHNNAVDDLSTVNASYCIRICPAQEPATLPALQSIIAPSAPMCAWDNSRLASTSYNFLQSVTQAVAHLSKLNRSTDIPGVPQTHMLIIAASDQAVLLVGAAGNAAYSGRMAFPALMHRPGLSWMHQPAQILHGRVA